MLDHSAITGTSGTGASRTSSRAWPYTDSGSETGVSAEDRVFNSTHFSCQVLSQKDHLADNSPFMFTLTFWDIRGCRHQPQQSKTGMD